MIAGAYCLHLYCDNCRKLGEFNSSFKGDLAECLAQARKDGWRVNVGADSCRCPKCHKLKQYGVTLPNVNKR